MAGSVGIPVAGLLSPAITPRMKIRPFAAIRPTAELADAVASPPYDVIDSDEARALAAGNEKSFLHVIKPEIDLPEGTDLYSDAIYAKAAENFQAFQDKGFMQREEAPCFYLYRQTLGDHVQNGLVVTCHTDDYENDLIKKHEKTLPKKEDDRTRHVATLKANAGPVFLTYRDVDAIKVLLTDVAAGTPDFDFTSADGVQHTGWVIKDTAALQAELDQVPVSYVADGHHRSASASRVSKEMGEANPNHTGEEDYNYFLCVLFPAEELNVIAYNRMVTELNGLSPEAFLAAVGEHFTVSETTDTQPAARGEICMYLEEKWYSLKWDEDASLDPVARLDVSILQYSLLQPVLGVEDIRTDARMIFKGGFDVVDVMTATVNSGKAAVAFSLYPVSVHQVMDVADVDQIMPPKSTWFEPKLRSGLFVHTLD